MIVIVSYKVVLKLSASSICRVLVRRSLNEGRLGMALTWCRESKVRRHYYLPAIVNAQASRG